MTINGVLKLSESIYYALHERTTMGLDEYVEVKFKDYEKCSRCLIRLHNIESVDFEEMTFDEMTSKSLFPNRLRVRTYVLNGYKTYPD